MKNVKVVVTPNTKVVYWAAEPANENLKTFTSLVYFTDGECYTSVKPKGNVLWVLSEESQLNENLPGKVIKLEL